MHSDPVGPRMGLVPVKRATSGNGCQAEPSVRTLLGAAIRGSPVTAEPGGTMAVAAAGRGHLRASQGDREHGIGALKTAFAAGLLAKDEFPRRVDRTPATANYAGLAAGTEGENRGQ